MKTRMLSSVTHSWSRVGLTTKHSHYPHTGPTVGLPGRTCSPIHLLSSSGFVQPYFCEPCGVLCSRGKEAGSLPVQCSPGAPVCPPQPGWALLLHRRPLASYRPRSSIAPQPPGAAPTISQVSVICLLLAISLKLPQAAIISHLALVSLICSPNCQGEHINQQSRDFSSLLGVCSWCPLSLPHHLPP